MFVVRFSRRCVKRYNLKFKISDDKGFHGSARNVLSYQSPVLMASRDMDRWRIFHSILGLSNGNARSASQTADQTPTEDEGEVECYFASTEGARRPSTIDDEARVVRLLKEILAYQESSVCNWIIESKVKALCAAYSCLLKPHKEGFIKVLAGDFAVDHKAVRSAARHVAQLEEEDFTSRQAVKLQERLKMTLTPQYSWLFTHVGRLERGVKFLVDLRTDVLNLSAQMDSLDPAFPSVQRLNITLRELLSLWFSVGFLNLERVTWKSPCEMLQKISEYEAVHPVRSWTDLKRRVGLYRRCFVYTHNSMPDEPLVVLHTALCDEIAASMGGIVASASRLSVDSSTSETGLPGLQPQTEDPSKVKAAVFYSITSTQKGLQGIELGNYLIKRVAEEVKSEFPFVHEFSTLSPIPGYRMWLSDKLKAAERGDNELVTTEEEIALKNILGNGWASDLQQLLKSNAWLERNELMDHLKEPLMRLCARYLYLEKHRGAALNSVANFHLKNGAVMWRLNWQADMSPRGLGNSCGIMVNYRYFLEETETNSRNYLERQIICASEQITQLAAAAECLTSLLTSKM